MSGTEHGQRPGAEGADMARLFMKRQPSRLRKGPSFMAQYRDMVEEKAQSCPDFPAQLRQVGLAALTADDVDWVRRGLQALATVGEASDMTAIAVLRHHPDENVRVDVETCLFEIRRRKG